MIDYERLSKPYVDDPRYTTIYDEYAGAGRGDRVGIKEQLETLDPPKLSKILGDRVCGPHMRDSIILVVGSRGSGKSFFCLDLGIKVAKEIASRIGGDWKDYFDVNRSVGVISNEEIVSRLQNLKKYQVVLLDDVGADAMGSRTFMSKENRDLSAVLQTCRTERNTILISTPMRELSDINISRLCTYFIEVSEGFHDQGISLVKVFSHRPRFRGGKPLYPFIQWNRSRIIRWISHRPPDDVIAAYGAVRDAQAKKVMERQREEANGDEKTGKLETKWNALIEKHGSKVIELHNQGKTDYAIQKATGLHRDTINKVIKYMEERE